MCVCRIAFFIQLFIRSFRSHSYDRSIALFKGKYYLRSDNVLLLQFAVSSYLLAGFRYLLTSLFHLHQNWNFLSKLPFQRSSYARKTNLNVSPSVYYKYDIHVPLSLYNNTQFLTRKHIIIFSAFSSTISRNFQTFYNPISELSFSTLNSDAHNVAHYSFVLQYLEWRDVLFECYFWHNNPGFNFACICFIIWYQATPIL